MQQQQQQKRNYWTSEESPETQKIKKRRQEGITRRQREHYWPSEDRDKKLCCRKGQKEEQVEGGGGGGWGGRGGAAIAKTKSTDRLWRRSGEGKAQDGRYESPRTLGILHHGWRAYKEDRALQRSTRKREGPGCGIFSHLYSILPLLFCSSTAQLRLSRASLVFPLEHSARLYVCLFAFWVVQMSSALAPLSRAGSDLSLLLLFLLPLSRLSVCLFAVFFLL